MPPGSASVRNVRPAADAQNQMICIRQASTRHAAEAANIRRSVGSRQSGDYKRSPLSSAEGQLLAALVGHPDP